MGTSWVGAFQLENGETVRVVYRVVDMPDLAMPKGIIRFYKGRSEEDLKSDTLRALVFGTAPDGSRVIYDCAAMRRTTNEGVKGDRA